MLPPMPETTVLDFDDYRSYLKATLDEKSRKNDSFSLRAFARLAGMSASHLSRTLSGQKSLSGSTAHQLSLALNHSAEEASHFQSLIELEKTDDDSRRTRILKRMSKLPRSRSRVLSIEMFRVISDWYHFAILALANTRGFRAESLWISRRLSIKPLDARLALERLFSLGLLEKVGRSVRPADNGDVTTTDDVASSAIQENHLQHLALAQKALVELDVQLREFNNLTLSMNLSDVPEAKKRVREFIEKFERDFVTVPGQEVFQLNVQLYMLSKSEKGRS